MTDRLPRLLPSRTQADAHASLFLKRRTDPVIDMPTVPEWLASPGVTQGTRAFDQCRPTGTPLLDRRKTPVMDAHRSAGAFARLSHYCAHVTPVHLGSLVFAVGWRCGLAPSFRDGGEQHSLLGRYYFFFYSDHAWFDFISAMDVQPVCDVGYRPSPPCGTMPVETARFGSFQLPALPHVRGV